MAESNYEVGPWAREKLDALGKYLAAYTTILRKQRYFEGFVYVDAFAGPGSHVIRQSAQDADAQLSLLTDFQFGAPETRELLRGSPRVALDIEPPFTYYVFVEQDPERAALLHMVQSEYEGRRKIRIRESDCNAYLREYFIDSPKVDWRRWRAVVLLDPFGMQVPWSTIEGLAKTRAVEVILNFPVGMAIQRMLPRDAQISPSIRSKLDEYFGTSEWFEIVYREREGFFGTDYEKVAESGHVLARWYRESRLVLDHPSRFG